MINSTLGTAGNCSNDLLKSILKAFVFATPAIHQCQGETQFSRELVQLYTRLLIVRQEFHIRLVSSCNSPDSSEMLFGSTDSAGCTAAAVDCKVASRGEVSWALPFGPGCSGLRIRSVRHAGLLRTLHIPNANQ